jgi:general secretion pathway protein J
VILKNNQRAPKPAVRAAGFTLLEVLLAMVISAVIAVMAYQALDGATRGAERTNDAFEEINQLDRVWQVMSADMRNVLQPDGKNIVFQGESLKSPGDDVEQMLLLFKRRGWVNFSNLPRSDLQLVSYRVAEGKLWRDFMPEFNRELIDIEMEEDAFHQQLLANVEDVQLRFLHLGLVAANGKSVLENNDFSERWLKTWPDPTQQAAVGLPLAIEVTISVKGVGSSVRLFSFPEQ